MTLVRSAKEPSAAALRIHGHTPASLAQEPTAFDALNRFFQFCRPDSVLVAHNGMAVGWC